MLRIIASKSRDRAVRYYATSLAHGDYYLEQAQIPSRWFGVAAERLGLAGEVVADVFEALAYNRHPLTGDKLTPRDGPHRKVGYDFNFHCPKGVSLAYAITGDPAILKAFHDAVDVTMLDAERMVHTLVRVGGSKAKRPTGNLAWGRFTHLTSRPVDGVPDPHLHAHCFAFNMTWDDAESRWKAAEFSFVVTLAPTLERRFHERLVGNLRAAGYPAESREPYSELPLFSESTLQNFSRRTAEINAAAKARGVTDPKAKSELGAQTRKSKDTSLSWEELRAIWRVQVPEHEVKTVLEVIEQELSRERPAESERDAVHERPERTAEAENAAETSESESKGSQCHADSGPEENGRSTGQRSKERNARPICRFEKPSEAIAWAIQTATARRRVVSAQSVVRIAYAESDGRFDMQSLRTALHVRKELIWADRDGKYPKVALPLAAAVERDVLAAARKSIGKFRPIVWNDVQYMDRELLPDEMRAVSHVLQSADGIVLVSGPGSVANGHFLAEVANQAFHRHRSAVILTTKQAVADQLSGRDDQVDSLRMLPKGIRDGVVAMKKICSIFPHTKSASSVWSFLQATPENIPTDTQGRLVIVDDAAALGVELFGQVVDKCRELGARLVVTGDASSVPSFGSGNVISLLAKLGSFAHAVIGERRESNTESMREGLRNWTQKNSLEKLRRDGHVQEAPPLQSRQCIAEAYANDAARNARRRPRHRSSIAVTASTEEERDELTHAIRSELFERKILGHRRGNGGLVKRLIPMNWNEADKQDARRYLPGMLVRFNRGAGAFKAGEQVTVLGMARVVGGVLVSRGKGLPALLPLDKSDRFTVLRESKLRVHAGEKIRFVAGGLTRDREHHVKAGQVFEVKRVTRRGDIKLSNGWLVDRDFGWLEYGYTSTLSGLKGRRPDLLLASGVGERLMTRQKFEAVMNAGRDVLYYSSDVSELQKSVGRNVKQPFASELQRAAEREARRTRKTEREHEREF